MNPDGARRMTHWTGKHLAVSAVFVALGAACLWSAVTESKAGLAGPVLWQLGAAFGSFATALSPQGCSAADRPSDQVRSMRA